MGIPQRMLLLLLLSHAFAASHNKTLAIFNSWNDFSPPVTFSWPDSTKPDSLKSIAHFENPDGIWFRWGCSVVYHGKMIMIGGMPDGAPSPKYLYEIDDCQAKRTNHQLPYGMASHVCAVHDDKINVCGSGYVTLNNNCTAFNGTDFSDLAQTQAVHTNGGMVSVHDSKLIVLGGGALDNPDTDVVEVYNQKYDNWGKVSSLPAPFRLFSTISMGQFVFTFGGFSGAHQAALDYSCMYDSVTDKWSFGQKLLSTRYGHRTVLYTDNLLHVGGSGEQTFEMWLPSQLKPDVFQQVESKSTLTNYTDFPENFLVDDNFCQ